MTEAPDTDRVQKLVNQAIGMREILLNQLRAGRAEATLLDNDIEELQLVAALLRKLIDSEVSDAVTAVANLQTEGLQEIFHDQSLSVRGEIGESRGRVSVSFLTQSQCSNGHLLEGRVDEAFGGSILTMQSILMRVTLIFRRRMRPLLLLDETLAAVANQYVDRAGAFLRNLCERLAIDVLLISHDESLVGAAHRAYRVTPGRDGAEIREVGGEN